MDAIEAQLSMGAASRFYGIPRTSLSDHVNDRTRGRKRGPQAILNPQEEQALENYMKDMDFTNGILGNSWVLWFKNCHPNLIICQSQSLKFSRAKGLNAEKAASFYKHLQKLYEKYSYPPTHVWNCDKSGAQAGRTGQGRVWAQKGVHLVHKLAPNEREHITTLTCINAAGHHIPNFYIFKGKQITDNYIVHCKDQVVMAMQPEASMTQFLFSKWTSHFICALCNRKSISKENRHLLIMNGHNSNVTVDVIVQAMEVGLDILTLPSHTSHKL